MPRLIMIACALGGIVSFGLINMPTLVSGASNVLAAPTVDSTSGFLIVGKQHFTKILASGFPKPTLTESGALPAGVTFATMSGFALLSGTPAPGTGNDYPISVTASNSQGSDTVPYVLTVVQNPSFPSNFCPGPVNAGQYFHDTQLISDWPYFFGVGLNNTPPDGMSFIQDNNNGDLGYLSGTPTTGGKFNLQYTADNNQTPAVRNIRCALTINQAPSFNADSGFGIAIVGQKLSAPLGPAGLTGYPHALGLTESGTLPSGITSRTMIGRMTFRDQLLGKPAANTAGDYLLHFSANNGTGPVTEDYVLVVVPATAGASTTLALSGPSTTAFGTGATFTATVNGGASPTGYVQFDIGGASDPITVPLTGNQATFTTPTTSDVTANEQISAVYTGDPANASSVATPASLSITPAPSTLAVTGSSATTFGVPITYTTTVTSPVGSPQGFVLFTLDGATTNVPVDSSGTATFTTDPSLLGSTSPHEVDATFSSYADSPGDWSPSNTAATQYTVGPVAIHVSSGDGNPADPITTIASGDTLTVNPASATEISALLAPVLSGTVPPETVTLDIAGPSDDMAALGLTGAEGAPSHDPETQTADYFWTIPAGALSGLSQTSASVTITYGGDDQFAPNVVTFTLQW